MEGFRSLSPIDEAPKEAIGVALTRIIAENHKSSPAARTKDRTNGFASHGATKLQKNKNINRCLQISVKQTNINMCLFAVFGLS